MANRLQKTPRLVYTPAVPAVAPTAPYCTLVPVKNQSSIALSGGSSSGSSTSTWRDIPPGYNGISDPSGYGTSVPSPFRPMSGSQKVCTPGKPGKPAVPSRIDQSDNFGWNGGGRSVAQIPDNGYFRCTLPASPVGVQVGLAGRLFQHTYSEMRHSLVARRDAFTVVELGATVFGPDYLPPASVIEIRRSGGLVRYLVNGEQVYQSAAPSSGEVYAGTVLYSVIDYVDSPAIGSTIVPSVFSTKMPPLLAAISDVGGQSFMLGRLPEIQLNATLSTVKGLMYVSAALPALIAAISTAGGVSWMRSELPALGLRATLGPVEEMPSNMIAVLPPPILTAALISGQSLSFSAQIPAMVAAIADVPYSRVIANLPSRLIANIVEPYMPTGDTDGSDAAYMSDTATLETALLLIAMDSLEVASTDATLTFILELSGLDSMSIGSDASIGWVVEMLAMEQVAVLSRASSAKQQAIQYAVNFMTGALTTYRDFDFEGFTYDDGNAYAWRKDGLYRIGAGNEVISALADFGATDYTDAHLKRIATAFIGVRTDGECYVRMCADEGAERVYKLIGGGNQKRADLGKGVSGRYWNVRLEVTDASYATVDNIELEVGVTQRRGYGRRG